jgi:hypothetical protein
MLGPRPMPKPKVNPKYLSLPAGFSPVYATVDEVCAYARQSRWTTFQKIRKGRYRTFKDGRIRKVVFASVLADMERLMAGGDGKPLDPVDKRRPGRPKKQDLATISAE